MQIKFLWNGLKINGKLYRAHYSEGALLHSPAGTLTIYAKDYAPLPKISGLNVENDTDIMTDYIMKDIIRVLPDNKFYPEVAGALKAYQSHIQKRRARHAKN